jgi:hypothetical protein
MPTFFAQYGMICGTSLAEGEINHDRGSHIRYTFI